MNTEERDTIVEADPQVKALLSKLHSENAQQERSYGRLWYHFTFALYCLKNWDSRDAWNKYSDKYNTDQLLSHSKEKCELIYMLARLNGAKCAIECGTSYGVSTIYLALAIKRNALDHMSDAFGVLTMEKDIAKAERAKGVWAEAGEQVAGWITLREGDLLQTLSKDENLPDVVDLLFLDAWTSLALPALKLVLPRLRRGSLAFADKTTSGKLLYKDFLEFVRDPRNCFMSTTIPFAEGFEVIVYQPTDAK
ncbi:S-adenosyl-L-methionine-dependent methyltransferase [Phaeosphaeriaceae sp. PMI808]|nr:S-adenosyl-L-methionine-dependent methyltransferase [Phaeosphaeriaceae sp. PMI808]